VDRDEAYSLLNDLLFKGFLTVGADLGGSYFIFKTINENELIRIKACSGLRENKHITKFVGYLLSFSVLSIDGKEIFSNRDTLLPDLFQFFCGLPRSLFYSINDHLSDIRDQAFDSISFLEGFTYTKHSRRMWKIVKDSNPNAVEITGIPGTNLLGLNAHQQSWVYINRSLDEEEDYNNRYSMALLIASASNYKGVRTLRSRFDASVKSTEEHRKRLAVLGKTEGRAWTPEGWAAPVDTVQELVAELDRQMHGVKDKHDVFIENYLAKMREKAEHRAREVEEKIKKAREGREESLITITQKALTPEETVELMKKRRSNTVKVRDEDTATPQDKDRFLRKISNRMITARS